MQVKLSKEFEYIFKAVLDRFEWEKKNTEMHGETFKPSSIINELAELVKTEASFQLGYNDDLSDLKCLCWVLDWDKYPFTQVLWSRIIKAASGEPLTESKKLKEDSTGVYKLCTNIEHALVRADQSGQIPASCRYKSIDCNYPFGQDYVICTYEALRANPDEIIEEIEPILKGWINAVKQAGAAGIKLKAFRKDFSDEAVEIIVGDINNTETYTEDLDFLLEKCVDYVKKIMEVEGGDLEPYEADGETIYRYINEPLNISMDISKSETGRIRMMTGTALEPDWADNTFEFNSLEGFIHEFDDIITCNK